MSTRQYARIVKSWVTAIGLEPSAYGTHTLRRTKATLIYRRTKNLRAVQLLLGHTKLESTVRYLGIEVDDALVMAEQTEVYRTSDGIVSMPSPSERKLSFNEQSFVYFKEQISNIHLKLKAQRPTYSPFHMQPQ